MTVKDYQEMISEGCFGVIMGQYRAGMDEQDGLRACKAMVNYLQVLGSVWAKAVAQDETTVALLGLADAVKTETGAIQTWELEQAGVKGTA